MITKLWADRRGSYTITFGLTGLILVVAAGGTTDMMRFLDARAKLQDAVDATALMVAAQHKSDGSTADSTSDTAKAKALLAQTYSSKYGTLGNVVATTTSSSLTLAADVSMDTYFLKIGGLDNLTTTARSTAKWSVSSLEIALVLDTTGSMVDNNKLTNMKSAASSMVDTISAKASATYSIKFGLVPFSNFVNVGAANASAAWIDQGGSTRSSIYDAYFSEHADRLSIFTKLGKTWPGCVETRPAPYDVDETTPSSALPDTLFVPAVHPDEPDSGSYIANDYMNDQSTSYNQIDKMKNKKKYDSPQGVDFSNSNLYSNYKVPKGPQFLCDVKPIQRLTTDYSSVKTQVSALAAAGSTNIPEGIAWGWRTLSPKGPFADGRTYVDTDNEKVMVVLTDGTNSINTFPTSLGGAYSSWGYPYSQRLGTNSGTNQRTGLDAKTRSVCAKAKAAGIKIYTIGLMIDDADGQQLLSDCSSGSAYYYNSPSADQLQSIFDDIAKKISKLRIAS
jgi:Flp pilus assembly protein TadG